MEVTTTYNGKGVKDVPANDFITAFSSYLKSTGKVRDCCGCVLRKVEAAGRLLAGRGVYRNLID